MTSTLELLLDDCKLAIICACRIGTAADRRTLVALTSLCKHLNAFLRAHRDQILDHYTEILHFNNRTEYMFCGKLHRENDLPAIIYITGTRAWYQHGIIRRCNDQAAIIYSPGTQVWVQNGQLHRDNDMPAVIGREGTLWWYQNGKQHRVGGPAEIRQDGTQIWYLNGKSHPPAHDH